jgi:hypothetical protein
MTRAQRAAQWREIGQGFERYHATGNKGPKWCDLCEQPCRTAYKRFGYGVCNAVNQTMRSDLFAFGKDTVISWSYWWPHGRKGAADRALFCYFVAEALDDNDA